MGSIGVFASLARSADARSRQSSANRMNLIPGIAALGPNAYVNNKVPQIKIRSTGVPPRQSEVANWAARRHGPSRDSFKPALAALAHSVIEDHPPHRSNNSLRVPFRAARCRQLPRIQFHLLRGLASSHRIPLVVARVWTAEISDFAARSGPGEFVSLCKGLVWWSRGDLHP